MDGKKNQYIALLKLRHLHHMLIAHAICIVLYWFELRRRRCNKPQLRRRKKENTTSQTQSQASASSKQKSNKRKSVDEEVLVLKKGLDNIAQAIATSASEVVKASQLSIPENEVWNLLVKLDIEEHQIPTSYLLLVRSTEMLEALLGCPWNLRKNF